MTMPTQARSADPAPGVPAAARTLGSQRYGYAEALPRAGPACKPHCGGVGPAPRLEDSDVDLCPRASRRCGLKIRAGAWRAAHQTRPWAGDGRGRPRCGGTGSTTWPS